MTQSATTVEKSSLNLETKLKDVLDTIEKEREREIISRRFGLYDRKETLEQIGEMLGITRERVRQLEKTILERLKNQAAQGSILHVAEVEAELTKFLESNGNISRVANVSNYFFEQGSKLDQARIAFWSELCPSITVINENDYYYQSIALSSSYDTKSAIKAVDQVVDVIKKNGKPMVVSEIAKAVNSTNEAQVASLASMSKKLATLNGEWGLTKWPTVNPKNIRDKIYVILHQTGKQLHFNEISEAIKQSEFRRKDVTTQAIHNELIKDGRFVLVGRGIYALKEWGYKKGTVSDVIAEVLKKAEEPLHRDEIVKRVLENRYVKETTILLNLQGKKQFKRVAKATYALAED